MTSWSTLTKGYPLFARVKALASDGVFVEAGDEGAIIGREQEDDDLFLTILWDNQTSTRLLCDEIERIGGYCEQVVA